MGPELDYIIKIDKNRTTKTTQSTNKDSLSKKKGSRPILHSD